MNVADLNAAGAPLWLLVTLVVVLAVGGGAGIAHLWTASATKRKLAADGEKSEAEADKVSAEALLSMVTAATTLVTPLERRIDAAEDRLAKQGLKIDGMEHDAHLRDTLAAEHAGWDYIAEEKAREAGIKLPPRPPLIPPREDATLR